MVTHDNPPTEHRPSSLELSRRALAVYSRILRSLLDSFDQAVLLVDERDDVVLYNRQFEELAQLERRQRLELIDVGAAFTALGATLPDAQLRELLASGGTSRMLELGGDRAVVCRLAALDLDELGGYRLISLREVTRQAGIRPRSETRAGIQKPPVDAPSAGVASPGIRLTVRNVLDAVAEFGSASVALIAWEYMVDQSAAEPAMGEAIQEGLVEPADPGASDPGAETMYRLTLRGAAELGQLRDDDRNAESDP